MIKKHLIFHSFFLLIISIWVILIFNVVLTTYSSSFLTSPTFSPFTGFFGVFYWVIVGISATSSFVLGLDKLGIGETIWKRIIVKKERKNKSKVAKVPKKPKTSKKKPILKKEVNVKQKRTTTTPANVGLRENQEEQNRKKDQMKSFYLFGETEFKQCQHNFGYLGKKLKNKPIPDECFGCPKILDCFKSDKKTKKNKKPILATTL